ncbi:MAG: hypothetical protein QOG68_2591, partial [Solirubrobacteraceae bacterium]|nr:hypothetical protein [Solirubrobacteraceae bacterium]
VHKAKELYRLNCGRAHPVPAHGTETFAMRLHITPDVTAGTERLTWALDLVVADGKQPIGSTDVMIVDPTDPAAGHESCVFAAANVRPCARGMLIGRTYPYLLHTHCGLNDAHADGRWWTAVHPLPESDAPKRYDRDDDAGTVSLIASDQLEYVTSKGVRVAMEPLQGVVPGCD